MKNYRILPNTYSDASKGFEIQDTDRTFISWDLSEKEMVEKYLDLMKISKYGEVNFLYPVRVGNMIVKNFRTQCYKNKDPRPFKTYEAYCIDTDLELHGFSKIHQNLLNRFQEPENAFYTKNQELLRCVFNLSGIRLVIYKQDIEERKNVLLRWVNDRDYPHLLENLEYEKKMQLSAYLVLEDSALYLNQGYLQNLNIKRNPPAIKEKFGEKTVIWRDDVNGMLGFSKDDKAHIYDLEEVSHLSIRQVDDGRIGFYSELNVYLISEATSPIQTLSFSGEPGKVAFFERFINEIKRITQQATIYREYLP